MPAGARSTWQGHHDGCISPGQTVFRGAASRLVIVAGRGSVAPHLYGLEMAEREYPLPIDMRWRVMATRILRDAGFDVREGALDPVLINTVLRAWRQAVDLGETDSEESTEQIILQSTRQAVGPLSTRDALVALGALRPDLRESGELRRYREAARAALARELAGVARAGAEVGRFRSQLD